MAESSDPDKSESEFSPETVVMKIQFCIAARVEFIFDEGPAKWREHLCAKRQSGLDP